MSEPKATLAERLNRLQALSSTRSSLRIPQAEALPGDWLQGCMAFPAAYAQSRLWFLHQLQPGLTAYHLPAFWQLKGELNLNALSQALAALIERHPTLRTSFQLHGSEVLQLLHPPTSLQLEAEPLRDQDLGTVIQAWQEQEAATPFDLSSGLLLRSRLLQVAADQHVLLINHHHIASDGWSLSVLTRDLTALYNAHRSGKPPQLQPLKVHYQDYAAWQRQRLSGDHIQKLHDYWISQLTGLEPLELPTDQPRPATPSHQGASLSFQIEPALLTPFEELCRTEGATLQMGLLALLALLLHRYSRQDELAIGIPIWGRNHPDLEPLIGFFINTLPIRSRFSANLSFRQLLAEVKTTSIIAYDHQELPFEQMVEALNLERDTSRNPLVQVMLQLIELPPASLSDLDGLEVEQVSAKSEISKLDLSFYLRRSTDQGLNGSITYATDLFCADRIERLSEHLLTLLASALQSPDAPAASLPLLPETERLLIESWQHGPSIDVPDLCVHQLFEQQVARTPDAIALICEDQQLSYENLNQQANEIAWDLINKGISKGDLVAIDIEHSHLWTIAAMACLKAGGAFFTIDRAWPAARRETIGLDASASFLINSDNRLGDHLRALRVSAFKSSLKAQGCSSGNPSIQLHTKDLAYIIYTSGSMGLPKGVSVEHGALALRAHDLIQRWNLSQGNVVLSHGSLGFDMTLRTSLIPLAAGATIAFAPAEARKDPAQLRQFIEKTSCDRVSMTPSQWISLLESGYTPVEKTHLIATAETLSVYLARELMQADVASLIHSYGPTEAAIYCAALSVSRQSQKLIVPIGVPLPNTTLKVLATNGLLQCPIGIPGELHIGGDGLARGYLNNPELTAEKFIPDPFSDDPSARLYKSGDLASWNSDGTLAFHGRIDQQIKLRGFRIEPGEIEANLLVHPAVAQVAVTLRQDDPANPRLIAYWVPQHPEAESPSSCQLHSFLVERLPDYMVPSAFVALETLPLTSNGKLDRKALPVPSFAGDLDQCVEPSTDLERKLHAIWAEVLGHSDFGITDNFFAIGGHSLAAARLTARIEQAIGCALPLVVLFQNSTIAGLAHLVESADWGSEENEASTAIPAAIPIQFELP